MRTKGAILVGVCLFVAAFGGGAVTVAQLSDAETATVSAAAGSFDLCEGGETVTYEFSIASNELEHVSGPDIATFSNYDYVSIFLDEPVAVDAVDFEATEPIRRVEYRLWFGDDRTDEFQPPATQGRIGSSEWFNSPFIEVTLTCADGDDAGRIQSAPVQRSEPESDVPNTSVSVAQTSDGPPTPSETSGVPAENGTEKPADSVSNSNETTSVTESTENTTGTSTTTSTQTEARTATSAETSTVMDSATATAPETTTETQTESRETATTADTTEPTATSSDATETNETLSDVGGRGSIADFGRD